MNGPIKMYRTKQIVEHDFAVELPRCMYALKNIHSRRNGVVDGSSDHVAAPREKLDIFDQVKQFLKNNQQIPGMAELEAKQEDILKQLAELKKQILSIKTDLKISVKSTNTKVASSSTPKYHNIVKSNGDLSEVIINVNPMHPPYSLEILQRLLRDTLALNISSHLHSTVSSLPENAKTLERSLVNFKHNEHIQKANIRLIWKNVGVDTELVVSHLPIVGEVNLLRYLARAVQSALTYDTDENCVEVDSQLDLCYLIQRAKTKTERAALLQSLNKSLGKSEWLLGRSCVGIVDLAAYSAIKQVASPNEVNVNMGKWFQRCEALVA